MRELGHTEDNQHHPKPASLVLVLNLLASPADSLQGIHLHKFQRPSVPSSWVCTLVTIQTEANLEKQQHRNKDIFLFVQEASDSVQHRLGYGSGNTSNP